MGLVLKPRHEVSKDLQKLQIDTLKKIQQKTLKPQRLQFALVGKLREDKTLKVG